MRYRLKDIFDLQMGKTPARQNMKYWDKSDCKWISIADLSRSEKYISNTKEKISDIAVKETGIRVIPANTVIMSFKLSIGKVAITADNMYSNEAIMAFNDKHVVEMLPEYIFYMFKYMRWDSGSNNAVMGKTLNKATISEIEIDICSIKKQQEIVVILDNMDNILSNKYKNIYLLDELVKARFVEMFGEIGRDDKGWGITTLSECCEFNPKRPKSIDNNLTVSFIPMSGVSEDGKIDCSELRIYGDVRKGFTYFVNDDVLFAKITPCMENGKGAVVRDLENGIGVGSTEFHVLRPIPNRSNSYWLYAVTKFESFRDSAKKMMTGTGGQLRVSVDYLKSCPISLPPIELQNHFEEIVIQITKSKSVIEKSLKELETLQASLMQKYFS